MQTYPFFKRIILTINNEVVGRAQLMHATGMTPKGFFSQTIIVDTVHRGRGYGQLLEEALAQWVLEEQPIGLQTVVRDNHPEARAWAEHRGFTFNSHQFESILDLTNVSTGNDRRRCTGIRSI
ncbi:Acetyltransferase (GNAT) family protein [compost metagenome]